MILTECVDIKVCPANYKHWLSKGYIDHDVKVGGRANKNGNQFIHVKVSDLLPNSNVRIDCKCDRCEAKFMNRYSRFLDICYRCRKTLRSIGNNYGNGNKGKIVKKMRGSNHPRWNPNKTELAAYSTQVRVISERNYEIYKSEINPNDYPRTLCGVEGGYQLDHIISIKRGFEEGLSPETLGAKENLQILTWFDNRTKHYS